MAQSFFNEKNKKVQQLFFAVKLNVQCESVKESEFIEIVKSLRKGYPDYFKSAESNYNSQIFAGAIVDRKNERKIFITNQSIEYTENGKFNKDSFNSICKTLYAFYATTKNVQPEDIKIIGKIYFLGFEMAEKAQDVFKKCIKIFQDKELSHLEIRSTITEADKNIHLWLGNSTFAERIDSNPNMLYVRLDCNNLDQEGGIKQTTFKELLDFIDSFVKEKLLELLNNNFTYEIS